MKKMICAVLTLLFVLNFPVEITKGEDAVYTINGNKFIMTFCDDFNGNEIDNNKWEVCNNYKRQNQSCTWMNSMTRLDGNGNLVLTFDTDVYGNYICGAVRSRNKFDQTYGYFEIKAKLQEIDGFWSAFWLMPYSIDSGIDGGADGTEIDIFEAFNKSDKKINHAIHFDGYGDRHKSSGKSVTANVYDGNYHTFGLEWTKNDYTFYIDGTQTHKINEETLVNGSNVLISTVKTYLKISLETGSWTINKLNPDLLPSSLIVDYVKVYKFAEHAWDSGFVAKAATCTQDGEYRYFCRFCNETKSEIIPKQGHDFSEDFIIDKTPTCEESGMKSRHCSRCGLTVDETEIEPLGHNTVTLKGFEATCVANGLTDGAYCPRCHKVFTKQSVIYANGHSLVTKNAKKPTYFSYGYSGDKVCRICNEKVIKGKKIAKLKLKTPKFDLKKTKNKIKITCKKVKDATGFQLKYKNKGTWVVKNYTSFKSIIKTLKKGKYSFKIRAFTKKSKNTAFSSWSKTKKISV